MAKGRTYADIIAPNFQGSRVFLQGKKEGTITKSIYTPGTDKKYKHIAGARIEENKDVFDVDPLYQSSFFQLLGDSILVKMFLLPGFKVTESGHHIAMGDGRVPVPSQGGHRHAEDEHPIDVLGVVINMSQAAKDKMPDLEVGDFVQIDSKATRTLFDTAQFVPSAFQLFTDYDVSAHNSYMSGNILKLRTFDIFGKFPNHEKLIEQINLRYGFENNEESTDESAVAGTSQGDGDQDGKAGEDTAQ